MKEKIEIDYKEFSKQLKEKILKTDSYLQIEVLISDDIEMPYTVFNRNKCGIIEQAKAIISLKKVIEELEKNPLVLLLSKCISCESETITLKNKGDK